jgi:hypothetical protein
MVSRQPRLRNVPEVAGSYKRNLAPQKLPSPGLNPVTFAADKPSLVKKITI